MNLDRSSFVASAALAVVVGLVVLPVRPANAGTCTDGVDCYCDKVEGGVNNDPKVVLCEDFEASTLHDDVGTGGGSPRFGPWYDDAGYTGARGANSHWSKTYGSVVGNCAWSSGQPGGTPTVGRNCNFGTCFGAEWRADDHWQGNNKACMDVVRDGEFDDEIAGLTPNLVHDGRQSLGFRVRPADTSGILGFGNFGKAITTLGVTMAVAYPSNSASADLWKYPWKHNEWITAVDGGRGDGAFLFHNTNALSADDPFQQFMFIRNTGGYGVSQCNTAIAGANKRRGVFSCNDVAMYYRADPAYYDRTHDWPFGTWACVQGYIQRLGTSNVSIQIWFNGTLIVDADGLNGSFLSSRGGYTHLAWNAYSNRNQTSDKSTQTTYRFEDNVHVRGGNDAECAGGACAPAPCGLVGGGTTPLGAPGKPVLVP